LVTLAELVKDGILNHQEKDIEALKIELRDRKHITIIIVSAILIIILSVVYLTIIGKFEMTTFTFLLGTAVGSMLTILAKMFSVHGE
jgi:membrane-associated HD superfamily phosphohydrolase